MANNYKVKMVDLQNKYKFKIFCSSQMYDDTDLKRQLDTIYKAFPKASATGTDATLTGTAAALMNIDLKGNVGKNLFDKDNADILNAYFETSTPDLSSNDNARTLYIECLPNTTYTITKLRSQQFNVGCTSTQPVIGTTIQKIENGTMGVYDGTTKASYTYTTNSTAKYLLVRYAYATQVDLDLMLSNIQIEVGSTATTYEAFRTVTGDNTIDICGKNLFKGDVVQGFYTADGNISASNTQIRTTEYMEVIPNTIYTFSNTNNLIIDRICYYNSSKTFIERGAYLNSGTFTTLNNNCKYIRFTIRATDESNITPSSLVNPQLEKGSTQTTFEPYIGKSYPIDLGSTKLKTDDSIQGAKNNWYIERADGTIEPIADTTLISQLNNLRYNAESYEGTTNISQANSDMPFIFDASAIKDLSNL